MVHFGDLQQCVFDELLGIVPDFAALNDLVQNKLAEILLMEVDFEIVLFVVDFLLEAEGDDPEQVLIEDVVVHDVLVHAVGNGLGQRSQGLQVGVVQIFLQQHHHQERVLRKRQQHLFHEGVDVAEALVFEQPLLLLVLLCVLRFVERALEAVAAVHFGALLLDHLVGGLAQTHHAAVVLEEGRVQLLLE